MAFRPVFLCCLFLVSAPAQAMSPTCAPAVPGLAADEFWLGDERWHLPLIAPVAGETPLLSAFTILCPSAEHPPQRNAYGDFTGRLETETGAWFQAKAVREGKAIVRPWPGTDAGDLQALFAAEKDARANHQGLWAEPLPGPDELRAQLPGIADTYVITEARVVRAKAYRSATYIGLVPASGSCPGRAGGSAPAGDSSQVLPDKHDCTDPSARQVLSAALLPDALPALKKRWGKPEAWPEKYADRTVRIRGTLALYGGGTIDVFSADQLTFVPALPQDNAR